MASKKKKAAKAGTGAVAAGKAPVGNILLVDGNTDFLQGADDLPLGHVVEEHAIDHVAHRFRQTGDFAVTGPSRARWMVG